MQMQLVARRQCKPMRDILASQNFRWLLRPILTFFRSPAADTKSLALSRSLKRLYNKKSSFIICFTSSSKLFPILLENIK